jgi:hypothetical protein
MKQALTFRTLCLSAMSLGTPGSLRSSVGSQRNVNRDWNFEEFPVTYCLKPLLYLYPGQFLLSLNPPKLKRERGPMAVKAHHFLPFCAAQPLFNLEANDHIHDMAATW